MEDQGRIDGAHNEAMGPVLIEGMVREMNHPRDPHDDGSSSFAGHDVGLRPGVGGPHEPDRAIRADVSDRHVLSLQLVAMQARMTSNFPAAPCSSRFSTSGKSS